MIWSYILIFIMEISSPNKLSSNQKYGSPLSIQDVCFREESNILLAQPPNLPFSTEIPDYEHAFLEIKSGFIGKKTLNSSWQARFFVLTPLRLLYFMDDERKQLKGCFNFASLVEFGVKITAQFPQISLVVSGSFSNEQFKRHLLVLQLPHLETYNSWLLALDNALSDIRTQNYDLSSYPRISVPRLLQTSSKFGSSCNFWNKVTISTAELLRYSGHLDILFLRSKSTFSCVHRFFMRSHYDHVGLLLKDEAQRTYLLEAVHQKGVTLSRLDSLLQSANEEYEQIGYRKMIPLEPLKIHLQNLENYVNSLVGKKYQLSLSKLLIGNDTDDEDSGNDVQLSVDTIKQQKTYFCSELIADIYLKFGVLMKGKSNNYWPKDFEENYLPLSSGFTLSAHMNVELPEVETFDHSTLQI